MLIGIDLGTTNTVVAFNDKNTGEPVILKFDNEYSLPSVIAYRKNKNGEDICVTGAAAVNIGKIHPEKMISSAKRNMCSRSYIYPRDYKKRELDIPRRITPADVASELIKRIKRELIEQGFAKENEQISAVISVPAKFESLGKNNTKKAGENAGLNVISLLPEPTAAAYYYARNHIENKTRFFVFDFGGGTLDFTIMDYNNTKPLIISNDYTDFTNNCAYEPITVGGDPELGGDDIDNAVLAYIINFVRDEIDINLSDYDSFIDTLKKRNFNISKDKNKNAYNKIINNLKEKAVSAKHELSERTETYIHFNSDVFFNTIPELVGTEIGDYSINCCISRETFENTIFTEVAKGISRAFAEIFTEGNDRHTNKPVPSNTINKVLMVGGSSNIPVVKKLVKQALQNDDIISNEPATAIAKGALLYANILEEHKKRVDAISISRLSEKEYNDRRNKINQAQEPVTINNENSEEMFLPPVPHILPTDFGIATFDSNNNEVFDCLTREGTPCPTAKVQKEYGIYVYPNGKVSSSVIIKVYSRERSEKSVDLKKCKLMFEYKYSDYDPYDENTRILITFQHMEDGTLVATAKNLANGIEIDLEDKATKV